MEQREESTANREEGCVGEEPVRLAWLPVHGHSASDPALSERGVTEILLLKISAPFPPEGPEDRGTPPERKLPSPFSFQVPRDLPPLHPFALSSHCIQVYGWYFAGTVLYTV